MVGGGVEKFLHCWWLTQWPTHHGGSTETVQFRVSFAIVQFYPAVAWVVAMVNKQTSMTAYFMLSIGSEMKMFILFSCCWFLIIEFHSCVPEVHTTNRERNEFSRRCQPWVTSFVPEKDIPQSLYPFLFFPGGLGDFVTNLLLAGHKRKEKKKKDGLKFHSAGRENCLSSAFIGCIVWLRNTVEPAGSPFSEELQSFLWSEKALKLRLNILCS